MNSRRRARVVLAVLVLASLVLITADFRSEDGPLAALRGAATTVLSPVQGVAGDVTRPIADVFGNLGELTSIREDNEQLQAEVEALRDRQLAADAVERENAELRSLLELRDANDWETVTASTVAFTPSNFEWTITIDVGSDDGVAEDMPVVEGRGLVGKVIQVTPSSSRVLLAIDPNFSAAIRAADSGDVGVVTGQGAQLMRLSPDGSGDDIEQGTEVVTNNYAYGVFPAGIPVGIVDEIDEGPDELSRTILVRPFVDFNRLGHVLVVLQHPTEAPPPVPDFPERDLDPEQLVPDEPSPSEGDSDVEEEPADDGVEA